MYNLLLKEVRLGVNPFFFVLPLITGALMLVPGWLYFIVPLYFCMITIPNIFGGYKSQNDLMFTSMLPVNKKNVVQAKVLLIVLLEVLHVVTAMIYGKISLSLYPHLHYIFFKPTPGFWGLTLVMLALFNLFFISMYFKTAYKYGAATLVASTVAVLFAVEAEWLGIQNQFVSDLFKGSGSTDGLTHYSILFTGVLIFAAFTFIAYRIAYQRFKKVEV
ncbi:ABC-2 transporter permease [Saccharibacillus sacchari]|uniref:ABC-2 transporter permease n=1 Tax=Saccharibacillus sacchari TaxID=456493 RepID=A0ACC6PDY3_9BACL